MTFCSVLYSWKAVTVRRREHSSSLACLSKCCPVLLTIMLSSHLWAMCVSFLGNSQITPLASVSITLSQASTIDCLHGVVASALAMPQTSVSFSVHCIHGSQGYLFKLLVSLHHPPIRIWWLSLSIRAKLKIYSLRLWPLIYLSLLWLSGLQLCFQFFMLLPSTRTLGVCYSFNSCSAVNYSPPKPISFLQISHHVLREALCWHCF